MNRYSSGWMPWCLLLVTLFSCGRQTQTRNLAATRPFHGALSALVERGAPLQPYADEIEKTISWRHRIGFGGVADPILASTDPYELNIEGYTHAGDSTIWTGHYLAAASYHYAVEPSEDQLERVRSLVGAIWALVEASPNHSQLMRFVIPMNDKWAQPTCAIPAHPESLPAEPADAAECEGVGGRWQPYGPMLEGEKNNGIYAGSVMDQDVYALGRTSRDQYAGVFLGLSVAYETVNDDWVRFWCRELVTRMLDNLIANDWDWDIADSSALVRPARDSEITFRTHHFHKAGLLQVGAQMNPERFGAQFASHRPGFFAQAVLEIETWDDYSSYYKYNLDYIHFFNLVRLERNDSWRRDFWKKYGPLRAATLASDAHDVNERFHKNALFNLYDLVINGAATWAPCSARELRCLPYDGVREGNTRNMLEDWLSRPRRDMNVDRRNEVQTCRRPLSWLPFGFGSDKEDRIACKPLPVSLRITTDFLWQRSPQQLVSWGEGRVEFAGIDFLLPYWMGRYYRAWEN